MPSRGSGRLAQALALMSAAISQRLGASFAASCIVGCLAIGPIVFPIDWLFHILPDAFPVVQRMHGLGPLPKSLWVLCGLLGVTAAFLLLRRPLAGFIVCVLFAGVYVPTALVLWGQVTFGSWAAIAAVIVAGFGVIQARRANYSLKRTAADGHGVD